MKRLANKFRVKISSGGDTHCADLLGGIKRVHIRTHGCWTRLISLTSVISPLSHRINNNAASLKNCPLKYTAWEIWAIALTNTNSYIDFKDNCISQLSPQQSILAVYSQSINCTKGLKITTCEHGVHTGRLQYDLLTSWSASKCCHFWFQCNYSLTRQCVPSTTFFK